MFCSDICQIEFDGIFANFEILERSKPFLASVFKALKISGGLKELKKIYFDRTPTTVFDFDWTDMESSEKQLSLLKCAASLTMHEVHSVNTMIDMNLLSTLIKEMNLPVQATKTITEVAHLQYCINRVNTIAFDLVEDAGHGHGLFPFASLINHSCDQNVHIVCADNKAAVVVVRPIKSGEQLFYGYR